MNSTAPTWKCPRCDTVAFAGQRFCRQCGHQHYDASVDAGVADSRPAMRPVSRLLIVLIVVLFAVLGGLAAVLLNDIRNDSSDQPPPSTSHFGDDVDAGRIDVGDQPAPPRIGPL